MPTSNCNDDLVVKQHPWKAESLRNKYGQMVASLSANVGETHGNIFEKTFLKDILKILQIWSSTVYNIIKELKKSKQFDVSGLRGIWD